MAKLPKFAAFVTGSHAYGTPRDDSDIDLVVYVTKADLERLRILADNEDHPETENYISAGGVPLRFGSLNLLCVVGEKAYNVWRDGTRQLKKKQPVTREAACALFRSLRKQAGFHITDPGPRAPVTGPEGDDIPF